MAQRWVKWFDRPLAQDVADQPGVGRDAKQEFYGEVGEEDDDACRKSFITITSCPVV